MKKVLFVCSGNVCRSQIAEAFYNYFSNSENAFSAGVDPTTPARYEHPTKEIIQVMAEEGIDVSRNEVKTLEKRMVDEASDIYVMIKKEECPDYLQNSKKVAYWDIDDPYKMDMADMREVRDLIKEKVSCLLKK